MAKTPDAAIRRVAVAVVHELTGADLDGLRRLPGYDAETDTLDFDVSLALDAKPGPLQPPLGLDVRHA